MIITGKVDSVIYEWLVHEYFQATDCTLKIDIICTFAVICCRQKNQSLMDLLNFERGQNYAGLCSSSPRLAKHWAEDPPRSPDCSLPRTGSARPRNCFPDQHQFTRILSDLDCSNIEHNNIHSSSLIGITWQFIVISNNQPGNAPL